MQLSSASVSISRIIPRGWIGKRRAWLHKASPHLIPHLFLGDLADAFSRWLGTWRRSLGEVRARWLERAHPIGTALSVRLTDQLPIDGLFDGLDANGALRLRLPSGSVQVIHAGDVFTI